MANILLVEDDPVLRSAFTQLLQRNDYTVSAASSAEAAIHHLNDEQYDLVLLDVGLPDMDGLSFMRKFMSDNQLQSLPKVIVMTNYDSDDLRRQAGNMGVKHYLLKAHHSPREVLEIVQDTLAAGSAA